MPRTSNTDRILAEHPALRGIVSADNYYLGHYRVVARTARADVNLMWRRGALDGDQVFRTSTDPGLLVKEADTVFGVWDDLEHVTMSASSCVDLKTLPDGSDAFQNEMIMHFNGLDHVSWNHDDRQYVHDIFLNGTETSYRDSDAGKAWVDRPGLKYVAWITRRSKHEPSEHDDWTPGKEISAELDVTVYKSPAQGWDALARSTNLDNVTLRTRTFLDLIIGHHSDLWRPMAEKLTELSKRLESEVYVPALKAIVDGERDSRGMTGQFGNITLMTYVLAGRVSFQLERGNVFFNSMGSEDENPPRFGPHAQEGTFAEISQLVDDFIGRWTALSPAAQSEAIRVSNASFGF